MPAGSDPTTPQRAAEKPPAPNLPDLDLFVFYMPNPDPAQNRRYLECAYYMLNSAKAVGIRGTTQLYTWRGSKIPDWLTFDQVVELDESDGDREHLHLLRIVALRKFVASDEFRRPTISLDTDILFQAHPAAAFDDGFDVGLTYECFSKKEWSRIGKVSAAVMFLNPKRRDLVVDFFDRFLALFDQMKDLPDRRFGKDGNHPSLKEWGGDEIVLMNLFPRGALASDEQQTPRNVRLGETRLRTFASLHWNCQYMDKSSGTARVPHVKEAVIRHFPGNAKGVMAKYAELYLEQTPLPPAELDPA